MRPGANRRDHGPDPWANTTKNQSFLPQRVRQTLPSFAPRRSLMGEGCRQAERHRAPHPHRRPVDAPGRPPGPPGARPGARRRRLNGARAARYEARRESPGSRTRYRMPHHKQLRSTLRALAQRGAQHSPQHSPPSASAERGYPQAPDTAHQCARSPPKGIGSSRTAGSGELRRWLQLTAVSWGSRSTTTTL